MQRKVLPTLRFLPFVCILPDDLFLGRFLANFSAWLGLLDFFRDE